MLLKKFSTTLFGYCFGKKMLGTAGELLTYDAVEPSMIWAIIKILLGPLKVEVYSKM